jgi:membrane dipeptidase
VPGLAAARALIGRSLVWDNHGCMPLLSDDDAWLLQLSRYAKAGVDVVGLNVGFDVVPWQRTIEVLARFRRWIRCHDRQYCLVGTAAELQGSRRRGRVGIFFDIEGGSALNGRLGMVELYRDLGVRWMLIAYNRNNALGGGCQDVDRGLTRFGRQAVAEMERVGMTVCCSHTGYRTTMDVMRAATKPVIFSHSNPLGVWRNRRNIRDEAIRACAASGGVVGINGIGTFLGANDNRPATLADHVEYVLDLVGPDHVGLGLDYVFDPGELDDFLRASPSVFPPAELPVEPIRMVAPERIADVAAELLRRGHAADTLQKVLGQNFLRVARATWPRDRGSGS